MIDNNVLNSHKPFPASSYQIPGFNCPSISHRISGFGPESWSRVPRRRQSLAERIEAISRTVLPICETETHPMEGASVKDRVLSLQGKAGSSAMSLRFVSYRSFQCSFTPALLLLINLFGHPQRKSRSQKLEPDCPFKNAQMRACKTLLRRRKSPLESSMLPSRPSERIASQRLFRNQIDHH